MQSFQGDVGSATRAENIRSDNKIRGYKGPITNNETDNDLSNIYLDEFTSALCSINNFITTPRSFPPDKAMCYGKTPSRTELIGCSCKKAYLTSPVLPFTET
jgi:hypothetical protein